MNKQTNSSPLVSIIVNCFNGEKYLKKTLSSILEQTYQNWEVIFWDNQSSDNSKKIFYEFQDKRFKYFYSERHTSLYEARNGAINNSSGEIIAFLDTDDWWHKEKLDKQIKFFKDSKIGLVYSNCYLYHEKTKKIKNGSYHGDFIAYHINGEVWIKGAFFNGKRNGEWKEFSDDGILMAKMNYSQGEVQIPDGYEQKLYNLDGKLIYSYLFKDGIKNGKAIEILHNVSNIIHRIEINKYRYSYKENWNDFY